LRWLAVSGKWRQQRQVCRDLSPAVDAQRLGPARDKKDQAHRGIFQYVRQSHQLLVSRPIGQHNRAMSSTAAKPGKSPRGETSGAPSRFADAITTNGDSAMNPR